MPLRAGWGLSPLARGKHAKDRQGRRGRGPIPAGAGETQAPPTRLMASGAYPRWRGGNISACNRIEHAAGLSPLARGKPNPAFFRMRRTGPIPAGAGETLHQITRTTPCRAYPRWRGGNCACLQVVVRYLGLSPLARGKLTAPLERGLPFGPIPAGAGETFTHASSAVLSGAYPRWRGGNWHTGVAWNGSMGLSPLARGKHDPVSAVAKLTGPIPAGAGETEPSVPTALMLRAYPRWRGGNPPRNAPSAAVVGLSPLARGKHRRRWRFRAAGGPIPAGAGETPRICRRSLLTRAYPRWRGGNNDRHTRVESDGGLSPLARGKRTPAGSACACGGPIPAGAGETA